jgi:hypothetical protein
MTVDEVGKDSHERVFARSVAQGLEKKPSGGLVLARKQMSHREVDSDQSE